MPSTITLQTTINITKRYIYNSPLLFVNSGDLAYSIGDSVRQFILSPPFAWRWNRSFYTMSTVAGQYDYTVNIADFGWLERATVFYPPPVSGPQVSKELSIFTTLTNESVLGQPSFISVINDDNNGNITFRLMMVPDNTYTLYIMYQKSAPSFGSVTDSWAPIPDYYRYLYEQGFLAKAYEYHGDERFAFSHQEFLKALISSSEGLNEEQKNIFLGPKLIYQRDTQSVSQTGAIARQGRGGG